MGIRRSPVFGAILLLAACAPNIDSGDPNVDAIVDKVVMREGWYSGCVEMIEVVPIALPTEHKTESIMIGDVHSDSFTNLDTIEAARKIAISAREAINRGNSETIKLVGDPDGYSDRCVMSVSHPQFSGDFAFVYFKSPGGSLGWYSFRKEGSGWSIDERLHAGWW